MTEEQIGFYRREKSKFDQLLEKFGWNEEYLFNDVGDELKKDGSIWGCHFSRIH